MAICYECSCLANDHYSYCKTGQLIELREERDALKAKLERAVEALGHIAKCDCNTFEMKYLHMQNVAREVLAEIQEGK